MDTVSKFVNFVIDSIKQKLRKNMHQTFLENFKPKKNFPHKLFQDVVDDFSCAKISKQKLPSTFSSHSSSSAWYVNQTTEKKV